ncbi:MAG: DUF11 domain-containing protein, partial [Gemmatimonadetes bacterium]|nr:DUF11 domain-containing protein [Gemmatimonadota bacterium]
EPFLTVGQQVVGDRGGNAAVVPDISGIALGEVDTGTGYLFGFVPQARIGVAKRTLAAPLLNPDSSFTVDFRLVVENFSLEALDAVSLTDPLAGAAPLFGTYVAGGGAAVLGLGEYTIETAPALVGACATGSANGAFDGDSDLVLATIGSLPAGTTCEVSFSLRFVPLVPVPGAGYSNQAFVEGTGSLSGQNPTDLSQNGADPDPDGDDDPTNDNVRTPLTPTLIADVGTSVSFPAAVDAGDPVSGTVVFENAGPFQAEGVGYTLTLSPGLTGVSFSNLPAGASASYDPVTGVVTFAGMPTTLQAGEVASGDGVNGIGIDYVQPGSGTSNISSGITTTTNQGANTLPDTDSAVVAGGLIADVTTAVSFPTFVASGSPVVGTILFQNDGPSIASDLTYTLELTPGLSGVAFANLPAGATATYDPGTGVVTFAGMPATLNPGEIASGDGVNPIELTYTQPSSGTSTISTEIGTSTNQGSNVAPDTATAVVVGDATVGIAKAGSVLGDTVTYDIKIKNTGTAPADSISIVDDLSLAFGASNFALLGAPTLVVGPTVGSLTLDPGYTGNPGGAELVSQANPTGNLLVPGDSAVIRIRVQVTNVTDRGYGIGVFRNEATTVVRGPGDSGTFTDSSVDGDDVDPDGNGDPRDDQSPTWVTIPVDATVGIAKSATVSGWRVTFNLVLVNTGNAVAAQITVRDDLDAVFGAGNYALATAPFFVVDPGTLPLNPGFTGSGLGTDVLSLPQAGTNTLMPNDTAVIRFAVDILKPVDMGNGLGVYENQARTTSWGPGGTGPFTDESNDGNDPDPDGDGDPGNNSIPTVFSLPMADLSLEKDGPATALVGDTIQYTLTVTNQGPGPSADALIEDVLPAGVTFVSASDGGTEANGAVTWPVVPVIEPSGMVFRTVSVEITQAGEWENVASVTSPLDPNPDNSDGSSPDNRSTVT